MSVAARTVGMSVLRLLRRRVAHAAHSDFEVQGVSPASGWFSSTVTSCSPTSTIKAMRMRPSGSLPVKRIPGANSLPSGVLARGTLRTRAARSLAQPVGLERDR